MSKPTEELSFVTRNTTVPILVLLACALLPACTEDWPHTPLSRAADSGDLPGIRSFFHDGSDPAEPGLHGWSPLVWAARGGHHETIRTLVRNGAGPDLSDDGINGWTPSTYAVHKGQLSTLRTLLDAGAEANAAGRGGQSPPMMAAAYGENETLRWLLAHGADPTTASGAGSTPLSLAVLGADDIDRFTLGSCQTETVRILVDHSPGLRLPNNRRGRWALGTAQFFGCSEAVESVTRSTDQARSTTAPPGSPSPPQGGPRSV